MVPWKAVLTMKFPTELVDSDQNAIKLYAYKNRSTWCWIKESQIGSVAPGHQFVRETYMATMFICVVWLGESTKVCVLSMTVALGSPGILAIALHSSLDRSKLLWSKHYETEGNVITVGQVVRDSHKKIMDKLGRSHLNVLKAGCLTVLRTNRLAFNPFIWGD